MDARDRSSRAGRLCGQPGHRHGTKRRHMLYDDHQAEVNGRHAAATTSLQF